MNDSSLFASQSLIEGIGFNSGFINSYFYQFEQNSRLICYTEVNNEDCENCELLLSNKILTINYRLEVFPNPSSGSITIVSDNRILELSIINEIGQNIFSRNKLFDRDIEITPNLTNGIYFLKTKTENQKTQINKILIQK